MCRTIHVNTLPCRWRCMQRECQIDPQMSRVCGNNQDNFKMNSVRCNRHELPHAEGWTSRAENSIKGCTPSPSDSPGNHNELDKLACLKYTTGQHQINQDDMIFFAGSGVFG